MWIRIGLAALILFAALFSSCTAMFSSTGSAVIASSYLSEDAAMQGAEQQYCQMEADLQNELDNFETLHPGYDEYRYELDDIEHDPYVLVSILPRFMRENLPVTKYSPLLSCLHCDQPGNR